MVVCCALRAGRPNPFSGRSPLQGFDIMGFGKDNKGVIVVEQRDEALTTLAGTTVRHFGTKLAITENLRILKTEVQCFVNGPNANEHEGLMLGMANGDLTVVEIKEALEAQGPLGPNQRPQAEAAERFVKLVGAIVPQLDATDQRFVGEGGSPMMEVKPRWTFAPVLGWNWFIYNRSNSALTTGSTALLNAKHFGVWVT